jgi:ABC-2 type transport system permease protein
MTTIAPAVAEVRPVTLARRGVRHELRAVWVVWQRDLLRISGDIPRIISSLLQPLLFLFVLGAGLSTVVATRGASYKTFIFPGVVVTGILFTAVFASISIVWDREFGFLREMLVAPISSSSIVLGKCLGGASIATAQSFLLIALAGLLNVPYRVGLIFGMAGIVFVASFTMTAFGLVLAARVKSIQTVMPLVQLVLTPLMFLSGALYPIGPSAPKWLSTLTKFNPLTYAVGASRHLVFHYLPNSASGSLVFPITWNGWIVPTWLDVVVVAATGLILLGVACLMFGRED